MAFDISGPLNGENCSLCEEKAVMNLNGLDMCLFHGACEMNMEPSDLQKLLCATWPKTLDVPATQEGIYIPQSELERVEKVRKTDTHRKVEKIPDK